MATIVSCRISVSAARFNVDQHQYQAAGLFRRVAEFLEDELWLQRDTENGPAK